MLKYFDFVEGEQADQRLSSNLESAIASGNDEVKQLAEEMQKLLSDRQATEKEIVQLEADMHTKNSRIKNLQVRIVFAEKNSLIQSKKN